MKHTKFTAALLSLALLVSGCNMSNTAKGGLIGGSGGGALGGLIGALAGKGKGAAIGAAVGTAVGAGAGVLIGHKMDKAKKAAEAANAQAEMLTDNEGLQYVKVTFDSGLLFTTSSSTLSAQAKTDLAKFAKGLENDMDLYIIGYTDNTGWKGSTAAQSTEKNLTLSKQRAQSVSLYLQQSGVTAAQLKDIIGRGESDPVASNATAEGRKANRRVEVYIVPSKAMIESANAGTLK